MESQEINMQAKRMNNIPFSGIREIFEECGQLEAGGKDIVHMEIGRPDFDTPEPIKQAGRNAISSGEVHYTSNYGIKELRRRIAEKFKSDNGLIYDPEDEVIVTSGATEAIFITILSLVDPGEEVLIPDPHWTYEPAIEAASAHPVPYQLNPENGFQPDPDAIQSQITVDTSMLIVNSPHNPTGGVINEQTGKQIRDIAVENDLVVLSDEIYEKIIYDGIHHSLASFDGMFNRTITVNGFSKAYSMTGWRLGYLAGPDSLLDAIIRLRQYTSTCASSISQHAGCRALEGELHKPLVDAFSERRQTVVNRIEDISQIDCPEPAGAFYAMPTVPDCAENDRDFVLSILRQEGVATVPGSVFGTAGNGRFRIAFTSPIDRLEEGFDRIERWIENQ